MYYTSSSSSLYFTQIEMDVRPRVSGAAAAAAACQYEYGTLLLLLQL